MKEELYPGSILLCTPNAATHGFKNITPGHLYVVLAATKTIVGVTDDNGARRIFSKGFFTVIIEA